LCLRALQRVSQHRAVSTGERIRTSSLQVCQIGHSRSWSMWATSDVFARTALKPVSYLLKAWKVRYRVFVVFLTTEPKRNKRGKCSIAKLGRTNVERVVTLTRQGILFAQAGTYLGARTLDEVVVSTEAIPSPSRGTRTGSVFRQCPAAFTVSAASCYVVRWTRQVVLEK